MPPETLMITLSDLLACISPGATGAPLDHLRVFVEIAKQPRCTVAAVARRLGLPKAEVEDIAQQLAFDDDTQTGRDLVVVERPAADFETPMLRLNIFGETLCDYCNDRLLSAATARN